MRTQILDSDFDLPEPNDRHIPGVIYNKANREAYVECHLTGCSAARAGDYVVYKEGHTYPYIERKSGHITR